MTTQRTRFLFLAAWMALFSGLAPSAAPATVSAYPYAETFVTHHVAVLNGKRVRYTATVKPTILSDEHGTPTASFVSIDYVVDGKPARNRPVLFAFAGGPSGPSVAYHLRLLGPRQFLNPGHSAGALRDNPDCLLDAADLVFVDPAETGFSRILPGGQRSYFYSVGGDAQSIEQFMEKWLDEHGRQGAPRYVMGGSYGSVRATRIAWDLRHTHPVDGVFMTADSLMLQEMVGVIGIALPLPTMANIAVYYGKVPRAGRTDREIVDAAYDFAIDEYLPALSRVQDLSDSSREAMAEKLQKIIGIPAAELLDHDLDITLEDFKHLLLKGQQRLLSDPYDARNSTLVGSPPADTSDEPLNAAFRDYMRNELHVTYDMNQYAMLAPDSSKTWDYKGPDGARREDGGNRWPDMLKEVLESNPKMLVYSANGLYDQMGVVGQVCWLMSRTKLPRDRITVREYPGGHAVYADPPVATLVLHDLRSLLSRAAADSPGPK
jgi:carboxypeptidase C (cathepsin A)